MSESERSSSELEPAALEGAQAAWKAVERSNLGDRMKRALQRVAGGQGIRESAEAEGYNSHQDLHRYAKRFGLIDVRTAAIIGTHRNVAKLSGEELERRLIEDPDKIPTPALAVIGGISTDKVIASEKVEAYDGSSYLSALEKMAARVAESGVSLELTVTVGPATPAATGPHQTIDITPREAQ